MAHMDSKYNTPGALDNGTGVLALAKLALELHSDNYDIDLVPINTEEYYGDEGENFYLDYLDRSGITPELVINIDSACHKDSQIAVSCYNVLNEQLIEKSLPAGKAVIGEKWYAGDHFAYMQKNIPTIALTSSNFYTGGLNNTHTPEDKTCDIDVTQINVIYEFIRNLLENLAERK